MTAIARRMSELRLAGMLLTRVPMGTLHDPVPDLPDARWAYPLVGLCLAAGMALVACTSLALGFTPGITALLVVSFSALLTGGLHEDGMADLADGFGGGHTTERRLDIMRDSRIGSYGMLALGLTLGLKTLAMSAVFLSGNVLWPLLATTALSRFFMLAVQEFLPPARSDGMGFKAHKRGGWRIWAGFGIALIAACALGWSLFAVLAVMALVSAALGWQAKRLIGGQTGDVLGAVQLATDCAGWLALSVLI